MDRDRVLAELACVVAEARSLELRFRDGKLWGGELSSGVGRLAGRLSDLSYLVASDRENRLN